jgi:hypothetical protein
MQTNDSNNLSAMMKIKHGKMSKKRDTGEGAISERITE